MQILTMMNIGQEVNVAERALKEMLGDAVDEGWRGCYRQPPGRILEAWLEEAIARVA